MKDNIRYHLLIDGDNQCVCIIKADKCTKISHEQESKLIELHGAYVLVSIHYLSLNCFNGLDVFDGIDEWIEEHESA